MTKERAIEILTKDVIGTVKQIHEAVYMAVEALEQKPCEDAISRQAAIDYINRAIPEWSEDKETAIDCLQNTPPVQPERKKGKWIWDENGMDWGLGAWKCNRCHSKAETWWANDKKYIPLRCAGGQFCGVCGCQMEA